MGPNNTPASKQNKENKAPRTPNSARSSVSKPAGTNGVGRSPSVRGGATRAGRNGTQQSILGASAMSLDDSYGDEARASNIALLDELRSRVERAETASEEYLNQLSLLQARLDESQHACGQLEDQVHVKNERIEELETGQAQAARQKREVEGIFEQERNALVQERNQQAVREEEMLETIKRLKHKRSQSIARQDGEQGDERAPESPTFAPPTVLKRNDSNEMSRAVGMKDRVIESLRLELAESQIKIMEIDSMGGNQLHELERKLTEVKIENARLTEDNESYQLLLSEKTLNGEFSKGEMPQNSDRLGSLAEELEQEDSEPAEGGGEVKSISLRRAELEVRNLKAENKSLTLYIEKIIGRLLQHRDFENIFDRNPDLMSGAPKTNFAGQNKDLPPPPPPKDDDLATSLLNRARSVVAATTKPRRPTSQVIQPASPERPTRPPGPHEDPATAPSIPLTRSGSVRVGLGSNHSHKRSGSDIHNPIAAPIVNQMYRPPPNQSPGAITSPGLSPSIGASNPFFTSPRAVSGSSARAINGERDQSPTPGDRSFSLSHHRTESESNSIRSDDSGGGGGTNGIMKDLPGSPPRSSSAAGGAPGNSTGAVMTQSRLRPLRLVQENPDLEKEEELTARKKANRASWMPTWMSQGT